MTDSEQEALDAHAEAKKRNEKAALVHVPHPIRPKEGETFQAAHDRMLREGRGHEILGGEVLGVMTGQVPVGSTTSSMPIAMDPAYTEAVVEEYRGTVIDEDGSD